MAGLKTYRAKRAFARTPEPRGKVSRVKQKRFVIQKHAARQLHYDFRLEFGGVLKSWAVPKGLPSHQKERRLAVHVEDHPLAYRTFHGRIPKGEYGAGKVEIWDHGTYEPLTDMKRGLAEGKIEVRLHGKKVSGDYVLVRMEGRIKNGWLMMKMRPKASMQAAMSTSFTKSRMPRNVRPMLAQLTDQPFDREGWIFETKWDGYRAIAEVKKGSVKLYSRNGQPFNAKMPSIVEDLERLSVDAVIDGEVVALDRHGRPSFQLLQDYFKDRKGKLEYEVFDLLYLEGHDLRRLPLRERKKLLKQLCVGLSRVKYSAHVETKGKAFFKHAAKAGAEGIMAKRADGSYLAGERSSDWLKMKALPRQEVVIAGYTEPRGQRKHLGALILAVYAQGELRYIGHTGGGSSEPMLRDLIKRLKKLERKTSPFARAPKTNAPAHWVEPKLVAEVKFQEWTKDGIMRQPILLGLRPDKKPSQVVKEEPVSGELAHADKIFWPKDKITKGDLARYYASVSSYLLPHLADRPLVLHRFPDGIDGEAFFQKDNPYLPKGIKSVSIRSESENRTLRYIVCNDKKTLDYVVQLGTIVLHPWLSKVRRLGKPDYMVIDLDPEAIGFDQIVKTAQVVKEVFDEIGAKSFCKTSGARGLHVCVPLGGKYTYEQSRLFAQLVASVVHARLPSITSLERNPSRRQRKVYLDCLQNREGQTLVAPYSVRPNPGAPVSTPLQWKEVKKGIDPKTFTINNTLRRLARVGDLWKPVLGPGVDLKICLKKLKSLT